MKFYAVKEFLETNGWSEVVSCGSRVAFQKVGVSNTVIVPNYGESRDIPDDVLRDLEQKTGLPLRR